MGMIGSALFLGGTSFITKYEESIYFLVHFSSPYSSSSIELVALKLGMNAPVNLLQRRKYQSLSKQFDWNSFKAHVWFVRARLISTDFIYSTFKFAPADRYNQIKFYFSFYKKVNRTKKLGLICVLTLLLVVWTWFPLYVYEAFLLHKCILTQLHKLINLIIFSQLSATGGTNSREIYPDRFCIMVLRLIKSGCMHRTKPLTSFSCYLLWQLQGYV